MTMMKKIGLGLFLVSLATFISTLSMSEYQLTKQIITDNYGSDEKFELFAEQAEPIIAKKYTFKYDFISDVDDAIDATNKVVVDKYSISDAELTSIIRAFSFPTKFDNAKIGEVIQDEGKQKSLMDYSSWMNGRDYENADALKNDLSGIINNINNGISNKLGIDDYSAKSMLFQLTKASSVGLLIDHLGIWMLISIVLVAAGGLMYIIPGFYDGPAGIRHNGIFHSSAMNRGLIGIIIGTGLILFYCALYWFPEYITNWVILVDPISMALSGNPASQWFLYGFMYCLAMIVMGVRMFTKYRNNKYQMVRTTSVVFFQLSFAFLIPEILVRFNQPYFDFKNMWPLDYDFFFDWNINQMIANGSLGLFMLVWGIALFVIGVPIFVFFFGKRWYCSWVCGCGGLAETLGDPFRQLSDKSVKAWKVERYLIHGVLVFAVIMTGVTLYTFFTDEWTLFGVIPTAGVQKTYGFMIGSVFSGVVGTGFYPFMGSRVWCRFGCPLAGWLGIVQRFKSKFRITTNGGQCISCGNCSTYCEMGIDVRAYAQKGQNIVRASCVGCGVCASACPRGVLKLENGPEEGRIKDDSKLFGMSDIQLIDLADKKQA